MSRQEAWCEHLESRKGLAGALEDFNPVLEAHTCSGVSTAYHCVRMRD